MHHMSRSNVTSTIFAIEEVKALTPGWRPREGTLRSRTTSTSNVWNVVCFPACLEAYIFPHVLSITPDPRVIGALARVSTYVAHHTCIYLRWNHWHSDNDKRFFTSHHSDVTDNSWLTIAFVAKRPWLSASLSIISSDSVCTLCFCQTLRSDERCRTNKSSITRPGTRCHCGRLTHDSDQAALSLPAAPAHIQPSCLFFEME